MATQELPAVARADDASAPVGGSLAAAPALRLSGTRKAAVLMAALGSERAAAVIQRLREDEIERLSVEMARLGGIGEEMAETVLREVAAATEAAGLQPAGGVQFAREVIERALGPERAADLLGRLAGMEETRPFAFVRNVPPERMAVLLRSESPQMVALVLASLPNNQAASILARLPDAMQPEVALRIVRMGTTSSRVIESVEAAMRARLGSVGEREFTTNGGTKALAEILNHANRSVERNVLESLSATDTALADEVRGMLFVFEDIVKLEERAVQQVLREVDQKDLVLALRGAPENVMQVVLANMSERGAEMLKEEMEVQQPQRKRDVEAAQSRVVAVVRALEEAGTIVIVRETEDEDEAVV